MYQLRTESCHVESVLQERRTNPFSGRAFILEINLFSFVPLCNSHSLHLGLALWKICRRLDILQHRLSLGGGNDLRRQCL